MAFKYYPSAQLRQEVAVLSLQVLQVESQGTQLTVASRSKKATLAGQTQVGAATLAIVVDVTHTLHDAALEQSAHL